MRAAFLLMVAASGAVLAQSGQPQQGLTQQVQLPVPSTPVPDSPTPDEQPRPASLELVRSGNDGQQRIIRVERATVGDTSGMFTICSPQEDEAADASTVAVFQEGGNNRVSITIDKNRIEVPLAMVTQRNKADGSSGDGRVEASAGSARFLDEVPTGATERLAKCAVEVTPQPAPDTVFVIQGKTRLKGQKLVYDESDGIARIDGPITFNRDNESDPLSGKSDKIEVDVDNEKTVLVGNVELTSKGGRISKADRVEYDDAANEARLYATPEHPAESRKGAEWVQITAGYIYYNLTNNDVAVRSEKGSISGEFPDVGETSGK